MPTRPPIKPLGTTQPWMNTCLVAESGFGKSVLLGTAGSKMLICSADPEGADSAYYQGSTSQEVIWRTYDDIQETYLWLRAEGYKEFEYVAIDSAPETQKIFQKDWLEKNAANAGKRNPDVLGMDGYQITQNQLIKFVKQFNDLPMHTLYTAKPLELFDPEGEPYYLPNLHGQKGDIARDFMGYMKIQMFGTYHTKKVRQSDKSVKDVVVRRWYTSPHGPYKGKDRTDSLGQYIDDPTLPGIAKMIQEKAEAQTRRAPAKKTTTSGRRRARA